MVGQRRNKKSHKGFVPLSKIYGISIRLVYMAIEFELKEEYIELIKLLKATQIAESGAMAKILVENGEVTRNGEPEFRKRAKIRQGETICVLGQTIQTV